MPRGVEGVYSADEMMRPPSIEMTVALVSTFPTSEQGRGREQRFAGDVLQLDGVGNVAIDSPSN